MRTYILWYSSKCLRVSVGHDAKAVDSLNPLDTYGLCGIEFEVSRALEKAAIPYNVYTFWFIIHIISSITVSIRRETTDWRFSAAYVRWLKKRQRNILKRKSDNCSKTYALFMSHSYENTSIVRFEYFLWDTRWPTFFGEKYLYASFVIGQPWPNLARKAWNHSKAHGKAEHVPTVIVIYHFWNHHTERLGIIKSSSDKKDIFIWIVHDPKGI